MTRFVILSTRLQVASLTMPITPDYSEQSTYLTVLTATPAQEVKQFVETVLPRLPQAEVITSRTGLAMLPFVDSAKGITFHLGETLLAEAHVRVGNQEGYAACLGRDLEQAIAIALLDATLQSKEQAATTEHSVILAFIIAAAHQQQEQELALLRKIETTRVELETF